MQISRSFLVACGVAYCLALLPLCAADADADLKLREAVEKKINELQGQPPAPAAQLKQAAEPAQIPAPVVAPAPVLAAPQPVDSEAIAKAREALRQKLNELETQPAQVAPPPVVVAPPATRKLAPAAMPAPAARPTPPAQWTPTPPAQPVAQPVQPAAPAQPLPPIAQPAPVPTPAPAIQTTARPILVAPPPVDSEAIAKAREALRQKMNELEIQPTIATPGQPAPVVAPSTPAPASVVQPLPVATQRAPALAPAAQSATPTLVAPAPASEESIAKARVALDRELKQLDALPPVAAGGANAPPALVPAKPTKKSQILLSFPPLLSPPSAVPAAKEQRLQELLRKYRADQVTPEEYHQQRAKILAEP
jgi:hypothetical protein